jgi:lipopolysaccharide transport protein LptA
MGVTIAADGRAGSRSFTVTGKEAQVGQNESTIQLNGDVQLAGSDGMAVRTEHATYSDQDALVRAAGPVEFSRGRMTGSGLGMTFDTAGDILTLLDRAVVHVAADEKGSGAAEIASGTATFARREKTVRFDRDVTLQRAGQRIQADVATAHLTADEQQIEVMELRGRSRIAMEKAAPGGLQEMGGRDMDLKYGADGTALEHALMTSDAAIVLAGAGGGPGRQIRANTIDVALAPDGATPLAMTARDAVVLTLPAENKLPERVIRSAAMDATGEAGRGLTRAQFKGEVEFRERGTNLDRVARAATLDVSLKPAMSGFEDATFLRGAHFIEGGTAGEPLDNPCASRRSARIRMCAARIRYDLDNGIVELTGSEPAMLRPRVLNELMAVDAVRIDVALAGPDLKAAGEVKSVLTAGNRAGESSPDGRMPSMFKQDRPVNVTADALTYTATSGKAVYNGNAQLWQEETSIKGPSIVLDEKTGDLTAAGGVTTVTVREATAAQKTASRVRSIATATDFRYEEKGRRATYTGDAHMNSPDGDMTASKIELYLKSSAAGGNDLERAEAYDNVTLRDQNRITTGTRLTYTTADERYVVVGAPVMVLDECRRETSGRTLTYLKSAETITIDGNEQTRTQTRGGGACP